MDICFLKLIDFTRNVKNYMILQEMYKINNYNIGKDKNTYVTHSHIPDLFPDSDLCSIFLCFSYYVTM